MSATRTQLTELTLRKEAHSGVTTSCAYSVVHVYPDKVRKVTYTCKRRYREHLQHPLYAGTATTVGQYCYDKLSMIIGRGLKKADAEAMLQLDAKHLPAGHVAPSSLYLVRAALG